MNMKHDVNLPEKIPYLSRSFRDVVSEVPKTELFQFAIFLFVQVLQWSALLKMCNTHGEYGTGNFMNAMMLSASVGLVLKKLSTAYKWTFFLSVVAMCLYFLRNGW